MPGMPLFLYTLNLPLDNFNTFNKTIELTLFLNVE